MESDDSNETLLQLILAEPAAKRQRTNQGSVPSTTIDYTYLELNSLEQFYFSEEDETRVITPLSIEPNRFVRNILGTLPRPLKDRLFYLAKFMKEKEGYDENHNLLYENLKEQVAAAYLREYGLRWIFRRFLQRWRIRRADRKYVPTVDPITLVESEQPIDVYDATTKYVFEAKTLSQHMESMLLYHEGGFALPKIPRNPWTNLEFTYVQLLSIYVQLHFYGHVKWALHTLRQFNFNKKIWHLYHESMITVKAIKNSIQRLDTVDGRELLEDFILSKLEDTGYQISSRLATAYHQAILRAPTHWYLERCKQIAIFHYEAEHFHRNHDGLIHGKCIILFKKQHLFLRDLVRLQIIRSAQV